MKRILLIGFFMALTIIFHGIVSYITGACVIILVACELIKSVKWTLNEIK